MKELGNLYFININDSGTIQAKGILKILWVDKRNTLIETPDGDRVLINNNKINVINRYIYLSKYHGETYIFTYPPEDEDFRQGLVTKDRIKFECKLTLEQAIGVYRLLNRIENEGKTND